MDKDIKRLGIYFIIIFLLILFCFREGIFHMLNLSYRDIYNINLNNKEIKELADQLNINEINYCWREDLEYVNRPELIIYHHTAIKDITAEEIDILHKGKGWKGIGYHYYISKNGTIYTGRPEQAIGAHTIGNNGMSLGICVEGNLEEEEITKEQTEALIKLSVYLCIKYNIKDIVGHRDRGTTLCPGKNFPMEEVKKSVIDELKEVR